MNILLTGANGFLGKSIYSQLLNENHSVFCLSRSSGDYKVSLEKEIPIFKNNFDLVIHAAGKAHNISINNNNFQEIFNVNVNGTKNLLKGIERNYLPRQFLFISSVAVYGDESRSNIIEEDALLSATPYGISKIKAEKLILEWCAKHNILCTILRLPLLVGPNPPGNLGSMIMGIKKGYYFNIAGGKAKKSMVLVEDVAKYITKAASVGGVFNITDGYHPSFYEISYLISKQLNRPAPSSIPLWFAKLVAYFGDFLGAKSLLNNNKLYKITSDLTFNDDKARKFFRWSPNPILVNFNFFNINNDTNF